MKVDPFILITIIKLIYCIYKLLYHKFTIRIFIEEADYYYLFYIILKLNI